MMRMERSCAPSSWRHVHGVAGIVLLSLAGGCATDFGDAGYQSPNAVARVTRDEVEPLRHPVESSTAYVERAAERLSTRPNHYEAVAEQTQDGFDQMGHWWDAVLGRPERKGFGDGRSR